VLDRRFPRDTLLSHDLIEGAYARAGLATDIEVIDDYPSHYSAYTRRKHRWVRGDWQIAQWLFSSVPDESGRAVRNPISTISRWKIFDNLRRSLVDPFTMLLLIAGWLGLRGGPLYWTIVTLVLMFLPSFVQLVFSVGRALASDVPGLVGDAWTGFLQSCFLTIQNLIFLPHSTMLSLDAIVRALIRRFVTGQKLLEWETAAEVESGTRKLTPVDRYLAWTPAFAIVVAALVFFVDRRALPIAAPVLVLWGCAGALTAWLNRPPREEHRATPDADAAMLREHALRIWRYFLDFSSARHHFLIPDNVEEKELFEAARVSPTNVGLLLNARQAAVEFGFLTVPEFATLTAATLNTMERLPKFRGHLFNWYNTETLEPLGEPSISSVDSGNLAASLYTLRTGTAELLERPLISPALLDGLDLVMRLAGRADSRERKGGQRESEVLAELDLRLTEALSAVREGAASENWWQREAQTRAHALLRLVTEYLPWLLPEFAPLRPMPQLGLKDGSAHPTLRDAAAYAEQLDASLARTWATPNAENVASSENVVLCERLRGMLPAAAERLRALAEELARCSEEAMRLATEMDFAFLVQKDRQMLSIGYEVATHTLHDATYDMLASEARIAAFLAVAKGEMPQESWFKMGRTHTMAYGRAILMSWTGTMFEYLMPSLWMRSYPETLMARTLGSTVAIQREYGRSLGLPWGISESGYADTDDAGHYHYFAWGVPLIALKWDADSGPVIAPYASYLALGVDPSEAVRNIGAMTRAGWMGDYGLYEAADYIRDRKQPRLVREWMAHHQGMSLLAILNLLHNGAAQRWFHANPHLQATELLLHEKPIRPAVLKRELSARAPKQAHTPAAAAAL
jgi:cyclic beta-1,2-glucan synthetase